MLTYAGATHARLQRRRVVDSVGLAAALLAEVSAGLERTAARVALSAGKYQCSQYQLAPVSERSDVVGRHLVLAEGDCSLFQVSLSSLSGGWGGSARGGQRSGPGTGADPQCTYFTGTKVQILAQKALPARR
jgi:hypothetical protein